MKKNLFRTILVLAALTACNKEVETLAPVVDNGQEEATPGKVTLTFTATISEETRTAYPDDKTGKWVVGDKITVCVSNNDSDNPEYKTAVFEATSETATGMEFTGQVQTGYTTIVSGVYPTNDVYSTRQDDYFNSNGTVKAVYLRDTYDLGTANDGGSALPMVGQMVEKDGTPTFTFHHICGALKIEVVDIFNALTFTTAETITGSFDLNSGRIEIPAEGSGSTVTFNYGRLATNREVGERGNRTFYIPVPDGTLTAGATMALKNSNNKVVYERTTPVDISYNSNVIKRLSAINLQTPNEWHNSVTEAASGAKGKYSFYVTSGTSYVVLFTTKSSFESTYHGSVAEFIEKKALSNTVYSDSKTLTMNNTMNSYYGKEYIVLNCAVTIDGENRYITFDYCLLDYQFPTIDYLKWIGKWSVDDGTKTDTWTITKKENNQTYTVTGLCGNTSNPKKVEALFNNGNLKFLSQYDFATVKYSNDENTYYISLVGYNQTNATIYNSYNPYDLMEASLISDDTANLIGAEYTYSNTTFSFSKYNLLRRASHTSTIYTYGTSRSLPATMTRVTE